MAIFTLGAKTGALVGTAVEEDRVFGEHAAAPSTAQHPYFATGGLAFNTKAGGGTSELHWNRVPHEVLDLAQAERNAIVGQQFLYLVRLLVSDHHFQHKLLHVRQVRGLHLTFHIPAHRTSIAVGLVVAMLQHGGVVHQESMNVGGVLVVDAVGGELPVEPAGGVAGHVLDGGLREVVGLGVYLAPQPCGFVKPNAGIGFGAQGGAARNGRGVAVEVESGIVGVFEIILMAPQVDEPVGELVKLVGSDWVGENVVVGRNLALIHIYALRHGVDAGPEVGHAGDEAVAGGEHVAVGVVGGAADFGARDLVAHLGAGDFFLGGGTGELELGFVGNVAVVPGAVAVVLALGREDVVGVDQGEVVVVAPVENVVGHLLEVGLGGEILEGSENIRHGLATIVGGDDGKVKGIGFGHGEVTFFFLLISL